MLKLEKQIDEFLEETRRQRDYHRDMTAVMRKVTKSAQDLKRNLAKLEEVERAYSETHEKGVT